MRYLLYATDSTGERGVVVVVVVVVDDDDDDDDEEDVLFTPISEILFFEWLTPKLQPLRINISTISSNLSSIVATLTSVSIVVVPPAALLEAAVAPSERLLLLPKLPLIGSEMPRGGRKIP